jgi:hypothetical protein
VARDRSTVTRGRLLPTLGRAALERMVIRQAMCDLGPLEIRMRGLSMVVSTARTRSFLVEHI